MKRTWRAHVVNTASCLVVLLLLSACSPTVTPRVAIEPVDDTACVVDGMLLKDFPGSKAQIQYAEGQPDFFCDLMDLFSTVLMPEQKRKVAAVFVQDIGKTGWEHPQGNWIDAKAAIYVAGSKKLGSMGPTLGSFSNMQDAETFIAHEGGWIVRFDQITPELIKKSMHATRDMKILH